MPPHSEGFFGKDFVRVMRKTLSVRRLSALIASLALVAGVASVARAESPAPADMKPFTEAVPGTELKFDLIPIPGGTVKIGSPDTEDDRKSDEGPQVEVEVEPFYMGKYEVTWAEYNEFLKNYSRLTGGGGSALAPEDKRADAVTYPTPMYELEAGPILDRMGRGGKFPAVIMSQYAARQYTKWISKKTGRFYRLPTEAEWEYACRAGTTTPWSFGDDADKLDAHGWFYDNSEKDGEGAYREVGLKKPNPWGLHDMHGNVGEWVIDAYDAKWYEKLAGKGGKVNWKDAINWPAKQYPRVIRGGGWNSEAEETRSASRASSKPNMNVRDPQLPKSPFWLTEGFWIGFRVVAPVTEPSAEEKLKYWDVDDEYTKKVVYKDKADRLAQEVITPPATAGGQPSASK